MQLEKNCSFSNTVRRRAGRQSRVLPSRRQLDNDFQTLRFSNYLHKSHVNEPISARLEGRVRERMMSKKENLSRNISQGTRFYDLMASVECFWLTQTYSFLPSFIYKSHFQLFSSHSSKRTLKSNSLKHKYTSVIVSEILWRSARFEKISWNYHSKVTKSKQTF